MWLTFTGAVGSDRGAISETAEAVFGLSSTVGFLLHNRV